MPEQVSLEKDQVSDPITEIGARCAKQLLHHSPDGETVESDENPNETEHAMDLMDEDSQSSNIIVTPDIGDFASYAHDDYDHDSNVISSRNEQADHESLSESGCRFPDSYGDDSTNVGNEANNGTLDDVDKLYSAYATAAAAAAAAASLATQAGNESGDLFSSPKLVDPTLGCRNLLCDSSGVIIAETVYRCLICRSIHDSITEAQLHYLSSHAVDMGTASGPDSSNLLANFMAASRSSASNIPISTPSSNHNHSGNQNSNLLSQLLRGETNNRSNDNRPQSGYSQRSFFNAFSNKSQPPSPSTSSLLHSQMLLKQQQRLKGKNLQSGQRFAFPNQSMCTFEKQLMQQQRQLSESLKHASEHAWLQQRLRPPFKANHHLSSPIPLDSLSSNQSLPALHSKQFQLHNQLIQSSLAEMLQNGCEMAAVAAINKGNNSTGNNKASNDLPSDKTDMKTLAMRFKGPNKILTSSVDNSPVSQEEFNEEDDDEDEEEDAAPGLSPNSDFFEQKSDDSMFESTQQSQFGYIPELNSLLTAPPKPGTVAKSKH